MILGNQSRCTSLSPNKKIQCGLPAGHKGSHRNRMKISPWIDVQDAITQGTIMNRLKVTDTQNQELAQEKVTKSQSTLAPAAGQTLSARALSLSPLTIEEVITNLERSKRELTDINHSLEQVLSLLRGRREKL